MILSRQQLKDYSKRALGFPVVEINADDSQLEDRIDDAVEFWRLYHPDGIEKVYLKHKITPSILSVNDDITTFFNIGDNITGTTSHAKCVVYGVDANVVYVKNVNGTFIADEELKSKDLTTTFKSIDLGSYDNRYIPTSDLVYGVSKVFPLHMNSNSNNMFDLQYQMRLNDLHDVSSTSLIYYSMAMEYLDLIDYLVSKDIMLRFNRLQNKLFLDINWNTVTIGDYMVIECYRALNPDDYTRMWGEPWLRKYTTALFKRQWGMNVKKFQGVQLPGGVTIDGQGLYDEAMNEIADLEQDLINNSAPLEWFIG